MNVEKKLAVFTQITMQAVEVQKAALKKEMHNTFTATVGEAVRAAEKRAQEQVLTERYKIDRMKNQQMLAASTEAKRKNIALREKLTAALFADIADDLRAYTQTAAYAAYMQTGITKAQVENFAFVQVMPRDFSLVEQAARAVGLTAESADEDFIGGFRLISADRRVIDDQTFLFRWQEACADFTMMEAE